MLSTVFRAGGTVFRAGGTVFRAGGFTSLEDGLVVALAIVTLAGITAAGYFSYLKNSN